MSDKEAQGSEPSNLDHKPAKEEKVKDPPPPWLDISQVNLINDLKTLIRKPLTIIIFFLGLLFIGLFTLMILQLNEEQDKEKLRGYVLTNYKKPTWYKNELPKDLQEYIHQHEIKKNKELEKYKLIQEDPREFKPILADKVGKNLSLDSIFKILQSQKLGDVSKMGVEKTELMNLSGINMSKFDFTYFKNFVAADLRSCDFSNLNVPDLIFRGASLQYAQFVESELHKANFIRSKISYTNFYMAKIWYGLFEGANARNAYFQSSNLKNSNFNESVFLNSDFSNAILDQISAKYAVFEGSDFGSSNLSNANFRYAKLAGASFRNAILINVDFRDANLTGADLSGADLTGANFANSDLTDANLTNIKNASYAQMNTCKYLRAAKNFPKDLKPIKYSWKETYVVPHDTQKK